MLPNGGINMRSRVVTCYDYRTLPVDPKLCQWHIPDSEIQAELEALARDHSGEQQMTGSIAEGDSVRCCCLEASAESWKGREVLLFPGRELPGAEEAEQAVCGRKAGEEFSCAIGDVRVTLRIEEVLRRCVLAVDEELMAVLQIPGVKTVEDYYRWYHKEHDPKRREKSWIAIVNYWLTEIAARSEIFVDEEEQREWCNTKGSLLYKAMLAAGIDLKKPTEERPRELTEEEAMAEAAKNQERYFVPYVIYNHFCEKDGFELTQEDYVAEVGRIARERGMDEKDALEQTHIQLFREVKYQEHTFHMLGREAESYLED